MILPMTLDAKSSLLEKGELYQTAKARALSAAADKEWAEASLFLEICGNIWPKSGELEELKTDINSALAEYNRSLVEAPPGGENEIPGEDPVDSAEAMLLAETAFAEERYYDAHWLASLAGRLARPGSAEIPASAALASNAWTMIKNQEPKAQEKERYSLYRMKQDAYEAMDAGDWIGAFYMFQELLVLAPDDPDVDNYFEKSKKGLAGSAFFIDELDFAMGKVQRSAIFSLPAGADRASVQGPGDKSGRLVLRFDSLTTLPDYSYAWTPEIAAVNEQDELIYRVSSNYGKIVPVSMRDPGGQNVDRAVLLLRALDRTDKDKRWDPVWTKTADAVPETGDGQLLLNCSYDDFLLLARLRGGAEALQLRELLAAEKSAGNYGYIPEIFKAEFLRRLSEPVFFLPMAVFILLLGWRYRARRQPRYVYLPMLGILPLVFNGVTAFYRSVLNNVSIWLSLSFDFTAAMIYFTVGAAVCFILALVLLAAQHG
jgi:hypothetical protein